MNLKDIRLSEISWRKTNTGDVTYMWNLKTTTTKNNLIETEVDGWLPGDRRNE